MANRLAVFFGWPASERRKAIKDAINALKEDQESYWALLRATYKIGKYERRVNAYSLLSFALLAAVIFELGLLYVGVCTAPVLFLVILPATLMAFSIFEFFKVNDHLRTIFQDYKQQKMLGEDPSVLSLLKRIATEVFPSYLAIFASLCGAVSFAYGGVYANPFQHGPLILKFIGAAAHLNPWTFLVVNALFAAAAMIYLFKAAKGDLQHKLKAKGEGGRLTFKDYARTVISALLIGLPNLYTAITTKNKEERHRQIELFFAYSLGMNGVGLVATFALAAVVAGSFTPLWFVTVGFFAYMAIAAIAKRVYAATRSQAESGMLAESGEDRGLLSSDGDAENYDIEMSDIAQTTKDILASTSALNAGFFAPQGEMAARRALYSLSNGDEPTLLEPREVVDHRFFDAATGCISGCAAMRVAAY